MYSVTNDRKPHGCDVMTYLGSYQYFHVFLQMSHACTRKLERLARKHWYLDTHGITPSPQHLAAAVKGPLVAFVATAISVLCRDAIINGTRRANILSGA
jgi:hypothetical protein